MTSKVGNKSCRGEEESPSGSGDKSYMTRNLVFSTRVGGEIFLRESSSSSRSYRRPDIEDREHVCAAQRNILWRRVTVLKDRRGGRRDDFREGEIGDKSSDSRPVIDYKIRGNEKRFEFRGTCRRTCKLL